MSGSLISEIAFRVKALEMYIEYKAPLSRNSGGSLNVQAPILGNFFQIKALNIYGAYKVPLS